MAIPKVFISSTCIDLKYIRSNLKSMIEALGYEPILSEYGKVFFDPEKHTHDSCLNEIENCQLFILIIGGRYGGKYKKSDKSITIMEYEKAIEINLPIFTLIDDEVYKEHHIYLKNKQNSDIDINKVIFSSVDSIAIFEFIDIVRKQVKNNAIQPFNDFNDIENYIKNQFAGLFFSYLSRAIVEKKSTKDIGLILYKDEEKNSLQSQLFKITGYDETEIVIDNMNRKYSYEGRINLSNISNNNEISNFIKSVNETKFNKDTWINPLNKLCISYLEFLQKKSGGQYLCYDETLIGTESNPGKIIKEYYRSANFLKENMFIKYLNHHKIAALYIRSFLLYCPFYLDIPDNVKYPELCLYTSLSNEYFSIVLLSTIFKAFSGNFDRKLIIDERYKSDFIKILYHFKKDISKLDILTLANNISLIEQLYFVDKKE